MRANPQRFRWLFIAASLVALASVGCGGASDESWDSDCSLYVEPYAESEPYTSAPAPKEWQLVVSFSARGAYWPYRSLPDIEECPDMRRTSRAFRLTGGEVQMKWRIGGDSGIYLIANIVHLKEGFGMGQYGFDLETDFAHRGHKHYDKPAGRYRLEVYAINCMYTLEVWERR